MSDEGFRPFSNGTEHMMWLESNCMRGEKGCRRYNPNAATSKNGCPIEVAVSVGSATDGTIPTRIAVRGGFLEPGANGKLVEPQSGAHPGAKVIVACPEFKGYDEPDDRPRRPPRQPDSQLDLLDPRNVPDQPRVAS